MRVCKHLNEQERQRIRDEYPTCASVKALAEEIGLSDNALRHQARLLGVSRKPEAWSAACAASARRNAAARLAKLGLQRRQTVVAKAIESQPEMFWAFGRGA